MLPSEWLLWRRRWWGRRRGRELWSRRSCRSWRCPSWGWDRRGPRPWPGRGRSSTSDLRHRLQQTGEAVRHWLSSPTNPAGGVQDSSEPEVLSLAGVLALGDGDIVLPCRTGSPGERVLAYNELKTWLSRQCWNWKVTFFVTLQQLVFLRPGAQKKSMNSILNNFENLH